MESSGSPTPDDALALLRDVDTARESLAGRVGSPWWYRLGAALSTASMFVGMGLVVGRPAAGSDAESASTLLVVLGACVAPAVLMYCLHRATGVAVDRYVHGMLPWYLQVFGLLALGFVLQAFLDVPLALVAAGAVAFVVTYDRERRIDARLRAQVVAGT
ncbi:hypothetical protein [Cellulomonas wangsupingiae]|uniref:Integral membrane protein n=1 Tax=Cellulomonas wangsupingiae TaxID=2968085 RepID=A0ABY5K8J8_9CELL|nr:hypothetical protein [Cellulomonas wangsupingiae]MCC2334953.1 hypothetical protein [Cellulomonas wangsupingiae]UUI65452.1 hypothetical protein NP075_01545 [Cellulomonas wangsupingiae]